MLSQRRPKEQHGSFPAQTSKSLNANTLKRVEQVYKKCLRKDEWKEQGINTECEEQD